MGGHCPPYKNKDYCRDLNRLRLQVELKFSALIDLASKATKYKAGNKWQMIVDLSVPTFSSLHISNPCFFLHSLDATSNFAGPNIW